VHSARRLGGSAAPALRLPRPGPLHRTRGAGASDAAPWPAPPHPRRWCVRRGAAGPLHRARASAAAPLATPPRPRRWCVRRGAAGPFTTAPELRLPCPGALHGAPVRSTGPRLGCRALVPPPRRWCWCAPPRPGLGCCPGARTAPLMRSTGPRLGCRALVASTSPELRLPRPGVSTAPLVGLHHARGLRRALVPLPVCHRARSSRRAAEVLHGPEDRAAPWRLCRALLRATGPSFGCRAPVPSTAPEARLPLPGAAGAAPPPPRPGAPPRR
jgi:hypothetical protein